ncbi:MAG: sodium:solute symporter family protein [Bacteroidota bacterium]
MLQTLDWIIIVGFLSLIVGVSLSFARKAGKDLNSFFLGGRNLPWYIAGISMVATTFAADTPLAVTELVAANGISGNWLWWCFLAGGMLTTFFFANLWRKAGVLTEVELIELRYTGWQAGLLRGFKGVYLGLFMNAVIIAWVNVALMALLEVFFGIEKSQAFQYTLVAMLIVAVYSSISGLLGVVFTDVIQFIVAITGCIILAVLVVNSEEVGGIAGLKEKLPEDAFRFFPNIGAGSDGLKTLSLGFGSFFAYAAIQWWASWYPGAEPGGGGYVAQRMMSARSEKDAVYSTLLFQVAHYCIRPWPWILVGLAALVLYPELDATASKNGFVFAMRDFLPTGLKGLMLAAFLAAYMSTISTQLNWGASYLVNDLYKRFIAPEATDKHLVGVSRMMTLFLMLIGARSTLLVENIADAWGFIIQCGAGLGLVLILRWYWWRINAWSEIAATLAPFISMGVLFFINLGRPEEAQIGFPDSFLITVLFTTIIWLMVTYLTRPTAMDHLKAFYERVRPDGAWGPVIQVAEGGADHLIKGNLQNLTICWLTSIVFTYSLLFFIGKIIFGEWMQSLGLFGLLLGCVLILRYFVPKTRIFQT